MSLRQFSLEESAIQDFFGKQVAIQATITSDPHQTLKRVSGRNFLPPSYSFLARATSIENFTIRVPIRIMTTDKDVFGFLPGQKISFSGKVLMSSESRVAALVVVHAKVKKVGESSRWQKSLALIRLGLREVSGEADAGALIPGMVLGDTSKQSPEFKADMRRSGLTHLVAVSGANFAIVSTFLLWCMQFLFRKNRLRIFVTACGLVAFIALVRPSPSVLRAAAMVAVLLIAQATRQGKDSLPALGFAIGAVVIADPWQCKDPGFALSVLATAGLLLFAPKVIGVLQRYIPKVIAEAIAPPMAAMLFCLPVIVAIAGFISPMSLVANLLVAPAVAPITIVGFIAALLSPFIPTQFLIILIKPFAVWIVEVAHWAASFPVLVLNFYIAIGILLMIAARRKCALILLLILLSIAWFLRFPGNDWQVANCDIGQGDALVVRTANHSGIVIDTGPDPIAIDRCLHQLGINEISLLILTHGHADHIGGVAGAVKGRKVMGQWFGNVQRGTVAHFGNIHLKVMWPDGGSYDPNNSSIAVVISAPDYTLFAGGDLEPLTQSQLQPPKVDIYKVCHHGSAYQNERFTRSLSPQLAIISVGKDNSYGHPSPQTISSLVRLGSTVLRTDRDGAIAVTARSHQLSVRKGKSWLMRWE